MIGVFCSHGMVHNALAKLLLFIVAFMLLAAASLIRALQARSRRRVLVAVLFLGLLDLLCKLLLLLRKLWVVLQLLEVPVVSNTGLRRDVQALLHSGSRVDALPPRLQVGEAIQVDTRESEHVDPAKARNVRNAIFIANEVVVVLELCVENANEALSLAGVALHAVCDALLCEAVEVVGLSLHGAETAVLPCHPLLSPRVIQRVFKGEFVLGVVIAGEVCEDSWMFISLAMSEWKKSTHRDLPARQNHPGHGLQSLGCGHWGQAS
jgi:hypothetical protein